MEDSDNKIFDFSFKNYSVLHNTVKKLYFVRYLNLFNIKKKLLILIDILSKYLFFINILRTITGLITALLL